MNSAAAVAIVPLDDTALDAVCALEGRVAADPWPRAVLRDELSRRDRRYLGAFVEQADGARDRLLGFAGWADLAGEAHVMNVAVADDVQRRGIGAALVRALLDDVAGHGIGAVTLEVRGSNVAARALYRRAEFVEAGIRPGYYRDGEDAVILWRR